MSSLALGGGRHARFKPAPSRPRASPAEHAAHAAHAGHAARAQQPACRSITSGSCTPGALMAGRSRVGSSANGIHTHTHTQGCSQLRPCGSVVRGRRSVVTKADSGPAEGVTLLESAGQQILGYNVLLGVYGVLGVVLTMAPAWALQVGTQIIPTELTTCLMGVWASFFWIAVGVLVCLREAAVHGRMASDTYKRLNLGMLYWAITTTVLQTRFLSITNTALFIAIVSKGVLTGLVCGRTYAWSNGGFSVPAVAKGLFAGVKDLLLPKTASGAVYSLLGLVYLVCWIILFPTEAHPLFLGDIGVVGQYLKRRIGAGMLLAGVVHYVLKDAADRGRLGASTFRQLNLAVSIYSIAGGYYLYRMWAGGIPLHPIIYPILAMGVVTTAFCDWQFFFAKK